MIDYHNLSVRRLIMHTINAKQERMDTGTCTHDNEMIVVDQGVTDVIKQRLIEAAGKNSKAFELHILHTEDGSFFSHCAGLAGKNDDDFKAVSRAVGDLLAFSQTRANIPGGYLIFMDCLDTTNGVPLVVVIKAEPHEALQRLDDNIALLKVFLSPSQKLFKIGIIYQRESPQGDEPNDVYGCFLFDDQFRTESHPAEYFYKDFLGFSVDKNAKIQSQRFFEKTQAFIKAKVRDSDQKFALLQALRNEFVVVQDSTINPNNFKNTYFASDDLKDAFYTEVVSELPSSIVKDDALIKNSLSKRKVSFPHNINITGPQDGFDDRVKFITTRDELLRTDISNFTVVRINGKPFSTTDQDE